MGLSNQERFTGIVYTIRELTGVSKKMKELKEKSLSNNAPYTKFPSCFDRLLELTSSENLWHLIYGDVSNNLHWIFGSDSTELVTNQSLGPWGMGVMHHMVKFREDNEEGFNPKEYHYNVFHVLSIEGLLREASKVDALIYECLQYAEGISYRLRRYDDEFRKAYHGLDRVVSEMMGLCFDAFTQSQDYTKAYLLNKVNTILYGDEYYYLDENGYDWVTRWLIGENMQHNLTRVMEKNYQYDDQNFKLLVHVNKALTQRWLEADKKAKDIPLDRIVSAILLSGRRFHYEHQHKKLFKLCLENGMTEEEIDILKMICQDCIEAKASYDKAIREKYAEEQGEFSPHLNIHNRY